MAESKPKNPNIRKLTRMGRAGSSLGLTLPKEMIGKLGWRERQKVKVKVSRKRVVVSDWKR